MNHLMTSIQLTIPSQHACKVLKDPYNPHISHIEVILPFSEAKKLIEGNANVRPPTVKKPYRCMINTLKTTPELFHIKNRGITYICNSYDLTNNLLTIRVPEIPGNYTYQDMDKFGIADGGHTFKVIKENEDANAAVRVHFIVCKGEQVDVEPIVEALNTSLQVQQYTLDEYQNKFQELKDALTRSGFDTNLIAFKENEDKPWHVIEIIQRMSCFLKDYWGMTTPSSMYKSKKKALALYMNEDTRVEFRKLYGVIKDIITLPEFIESEFSKGGMLKNRKFGKLKAVRLQDGVITRPGTIYKTYHKMDRAAVLPMASAFRELLVLKNGQYIWSKNPYMMFKACGKALYSALALHIHQSSTSELGSNSNYWSMCSNIVIKSSTHEHQVPTPLPYHSNN